MSFASLERDSLSDWQSAMLEIQRLENELAELRAQRDQLRTAADCLLRLAERSGLCRFGESRCEMDMVRAALARCEKGEA